MEENIEVKDVQKTEYLDKNGLDMLWTKIKENAHNQVEVEYNRAKAKEDSLSQEIASVKPDEGKSYIQAKLTSKEQDGDSCSYDVAGNISFKSEYSDSYSGPITQIDKNGIDINFDNDPTFGSTGSLKVKMNNDYNITMQGNGRLLHDTKDTFNQVSISLLDNVDTTYANSSSGNSMLISQLGIFYTSQGYALTSNDLLTGHGSYKTIGTDIAPLENGKIPAEYLDMSQYAKKSELPTAATKEDLGVVKVGDGLNVADGTISVDTTAIGTGNYIPYERIDDHINYKVYITKRNEGILFDAGSESISISRGEMNIKSAVRELSFTPSFIWLQEISDNGNRQTLLVELNENGLRLRNGDNNHVLTSYGSTIDITEYVLKSVYDKKIAALEARIVALEAKHAEAV